MWCPNCKRDCGAAARCPVCGGALTEGPAEPEFLMYLVDRQELERAEALLAQCRIPHQWEPDEDGDGNEDDAEAGAALYVDRRWTHRAMRLLRPMERGAAGLDEEALEAEMERYTAAYGSADDPEDDRPVSPEGYRIVWIFLAVFVILALIPLLRSLWYAL